MALSSHSKSKHLNSFLANRYVHTTPIVASVLAFILMMGAVLPATQGRYIASRAAERSTSSTVSAGSLYRVLNKPVRFFDSRKVNPIPCGFSSGQPVQANSATYISVKTDCLGLKNISPATAIEANLTIINAPSAGYAVLYSGGIKPNTANIVFNAGDTVSSHVTLPVRNGAVTLYTTATAHFTLDVSGYYTGQNIEGIQPPNAQYQLSTGSFYHAYVTPIRYTDTRSLGSIDSYRGKMQGENRIAIPSYILPPGGTALVGRVTVVDPDTAGYLTVYGQAGSNPGTADLVYPAHGVVGNEFVTAVTPGSPDSFTYFYVNSTAKTHLVIDLIGYYNLGSAWNTSHPDYISTEGAAYYPLRIASRLFDSRIGQKSCSTSAPTGPIPANGYYHPGVYEWCAGIPNTQGTSKILTGTVTVVGPSASGFLRLSGFDGQNGKHASLNFEAGKLVSNGFHMIYDLDPSGHPSFTVNSSASTDVVFDATGYFEPQH